MPDPALMLHTRSPAGSRPPRLAEDNYVGSRAYFLTICTAGRQPFFRDPVVVDLTWLQFLKTSADHGCEITAYCFMLDHLHALITGLQEDSSLLRFVKIAKQRSGYRFKQARHSCYGRRAITTVCCGRRRPYRM